MIMTSRRIPSTRSVPRRSGLRSKPSHRASRATRAEQAALRQVPATLLQAAPGPRHGARKVPDTPAQWPGPDGLLRTGRVFAPAGAAAGSRVKVWINQAGEVVSPPDAAGGDR